MIKHILGYTYSDYDSCLSYTKCTKISTIRSMLYLSSMCMALKSVKMLQNMILNKPNLDI